MILYQVTRLACYSKFHGRIVLPLAPKWANSSLLGKPASRKVCIRLQYNNAYRQSNHTPTSKCENSEQITSAFATVDQLPSGKALVNEVGIKLDPKWMQINTKWHQYPKIYMSLSKWYLTLFVAMTADAGFCLAPVAFEHHTFFFATVGTILCSCAANTFNQIAEVPYDAQMDRTKNRPLVRGVITPMHATTFGIISAITGVSCLYYGVNGLTAALGLANVILYAAIYTPLKRRHWLNTWAGAIVGAVPPIMGWTAAMGTLDPGAFILAGILYSWQFPHFFGLAWRRKGDYARGSYRMLPLSHPGATKAVVVAHSLALCGISLAAPFTGVTSWAFVAMSTPFNAWLMRESVRFYRYGDLLRIWYHAVIHCFYFFWDVTIFITLHNKSNRPCGLVDDPCKHIGRHHGFSFDAALLAVLLPVCASVAGPTSNATSH